MHLYVVETGYGPQALDSIWSTPAEADQRARHLIWSDRRVATVRRVGMDALAEQPRTLSDYVFYPDRADLEHVQRIERAVPENL